MTDVLPRIGPQRLSRHVVAVIEQRILSGAWAAGSRVPTEAELGGQLGVSRSVVRDAVQTLSARGLVDVRQGVGMTVAQPTDEAYADAGLMLLLRADVTVREALQARAELEIAVAGVAATARTAADIEGLDDLYTQLADAATAIDVPRALAVDLRLHSAILEATHLPVLVTLLRPLAEIIRRTSTPPAAEVLGFDIPAHRAVVAGLRSGDAELARRRMREHFAFLYDERYAELHATRLRDAPSARVEIELGAA